MVIYSLEKDCCICGQYILPGEKFSTKGVGIFHDSCFDKLIMQFSKEDYTKRYDIEYFTGHSEFETQLFWEKGMLRYGDQCAAIAYALGFKTFDEVREILGFSDYGKVLYPKITAGEQILKLWNSKAYRRFPNKVLEIGGGRGEVSLGLEGIGLNVQLIEPSKDLRKLLDLTKSIFEFPDYYLGNHLQIINLPLGEALSYIDWEELDTIIFIESIEHILEGEFEGFFSIMKEKFKGLFIITNWIDFHPIPLNPPWHLRRIDDAFYNRLCRGGKRIFRRGSHLVVEY